MNIDWEYKFSQAARTEQTNHQVASAHVSLLKSSLLDFMPGGPNLLVNKQTGSERVKTTWPWKKTEKRRGGGEELKERNKSYLIRNQHDSSPREIERQIILINKGAWEGGWVQNHRTKIHHFSTPSKSQSENATENKRVFIATAGKPIKSLEMNPKWNRYVENMVSLTTTKDIKEWRKVPCF